MSGKNEKAQLAYASRAFFVKRDVVCLGLVDGDCDGRGDRSCRGTFEGDHRRLGDGQVDVAGRHEPCCYRRSCHRDYCRDYVHHARCVHVSRVGSALSSTSLPASFRSEVAWSAPPMEFLAIADPSADSFITEAVMLDA